MYHILPELKLRGIFPAVYFVNTNTPEERVQLLLLKNNLANVQTTAKHVKKSNVNRYVLRPRGTFCNSKYIKLDNFCQSEFLAYYTFENKPSKTGEYQPDELDDKLIENNHEECS